MGYLRTLGDIARVRTISDIVLRDVTALMHYFRNNAGEEAGFAPPPPDKNNLMLRFVINVLSDL